MRLHRLTVLLLTATVMTVPAIAQEMPSGYDVVAGDVGVYSRPGVMTLSHTTDSAIVNWNSFSIGTGGEVRVLQPGANSVLLNRVTGDTVSTIAGRLTANGQVFIINPNGIAITATGVVNTAGFTASTLGISNEDFLARNYTFAGDGSSAAVSNAGRIEVASGGYAALLGGRVSNSGSIIAPLGKIGLGAAELVTLDLTGDGFLQVAVPSEASGDEALISNSGLISADGGYVELSVAAAKDAARNVINLSGTIEARSFSGRSGAIVLSGDGGTVNVSGTLDTSTTSAPPPPRKVAIVPIPAPRPSFRGGDITITGNAIRLADAYIDASGFDGGGDIRIGGDFHGNGLVPTSTTLDVDFLTSIKADALIDGDGGTIVLWSNEKTSFAGNISARGLGEDGEGGTVEVSGAHFLDYVGHTDTRAPSGKWGTLLLDPTNIAITNTVPPAGYSGIMATTIESNLLATNVSISTSTYFPESGQPGHMLILSPINWLTGATLELIADGDMTFGTGADLIGPNGNIILRAAGDISTEELRSTNVNVTGRNIYLFIVNATGVTTVNGTGLVDIDEEMNSDGGINITAGGDLRTYFDEVGMESLNGDITLIAANDLFLAHPYMRAPNGNITIRAGRDANMAGVMTAGRAFNVFAARNIDLTIPPAAVNTPSASVNANTSFMQAGGTLFIRTGSTVTASSVVFNTGAFRNEAGPGGLTTPGGRFIIYSADWDMDARGGLTGANLYNRTFTSAPPSSFPQTGNFFVYARQPILTITIADAMRMFFTSLSSVPGATFSGLVNGDTIGYALVGDYTDVRDTTSPTDFPGYYPGALRSFGLSSPAGYAINFVGGNLTITPATAGTVPQAGTPPAPRYPAAGPAPTIVGLNDPAADALPGILDAEISPGDAAVTLRNVEQVSAQFSAAIAECERQLEIDGDNAAYLTCTGDALEEYADALENPLIKLPPELKATVAVIRQTAQRVRAAAANPNSKAAVAEARQAVGEMVDFVRQQTALVRAVDPDTQALLQQSGQAMTQALNEVSLQLVSAVEI